MVVKAAADHDLRATVRPAIVLDQKVIVRQEIVLAVKAKANVLSAHQQRNKLRSQRMA